MIIGEVIGSVTLSRCHPSIQGGSWRVVVPLDLPALQGSDSGRGEPFVVFDEIGSGNGSLIAVSEGAEAAAPFQPNPKPLDAYCTALLDVVDIKDGTDFS
ncbi:Ethanolamine utilization protein EutN/carboxysome [Thalassoglobus neptunius]|uniref:Ethanolamine utilization protein EutN/carboxysome n=1 Tax=Thalassoglobus neptunius TaxID=1938619 RepID=A0A5C5X5G0_9PLAN|nr:EutN/CcmL family microcompartment protein [Thalassoglobus neptunius]TWT57988.1 Ethanolamine utilization protein EutN/carboxysome [Thalassoglobus neptunius]